MRRRTVGLSCRPPPWKRLSPLRGGVIEPSHLERDAGSARKAEASASRSGGRGEHDNEGNENSADTRHDELYSLRLAKRAYCTSVKQAETCREPTVLYSGLSRYCGVAETRSGSLDIDARQSDGHSASGGVARMKSTSMSRFSSLRVLSALSAKRAWIAASPCLAMSSDSITWIVDMVIDNAACCSRGEVTVSTVASRGR